MAETLRALLENAHKNSVGGIECHVQRGFGKLRRSPAASGFKDFARSPIEKTAPAHFA
jgi:hypothetical protein